MIILGINAFHGDSAAAIVRGGALVAAAEEERFRRLKHWAGFPTQAIAYCLREADVTLADVEHVAVNQDNRANFLRKLVYMGSQRPDFELILNRLRSSASAPERRGNVIGAAAPAAVSVARCTASSTISRTFPRRSMFPHLKKLSSSQSMASEISAAPHGGLAEEKPSPSRDACISRIRLGSSTRR